MENALVYPRHAVALVVLLLGPGRRFSEAHDNVSMRMAALLKLDHADEKARAAAIVLLDGEPPLAVLKVWRAPDRSRIQACVKRLQREVEDTRHNLRRRHVQQQKSRA